MSLDAKVIIIVAIISVLVMLFADPNAINDALTFHPDREYSDEAVNWSSYPIHEFSLDLPFFTRRAGMLSVSDCGKFKYYINRRDEQNAEAD